MSMTKSIRIGALFVSFASLSSIAASAADQDPPYIQHIRGIQSVVICNGQVVHIKDVGESPCNNLLAPTTRSAKAAVTTDQPPLLTQAVVDPILIGLKTLTVCNGGFVTPDLKRQTFPCTEWKIDFRHSQIFAAYQLYPEVALYTGNVIDSCGSSSAAILAIETPTPEVAVLSVRMNVCDGYPSSGSIIPQLYAEAQCQLYTGDHTRMSGVVSSTLFDNKRLDGHPTAVQMSYGVCDLGSALP